MQITNTISMKKRAIHWLDDGLYAHWLYLQTTRFMEPKLAIKSLCIAYGYERWREEFADKS